MNANQILSDPSFNIDPQNLTLSAGSPLIWGVCSPGFGIHGLALWISNKDGETLLVYVKNGILKWGIKKNSVLKIAGNDVLNPIHLWTLVQKFQRCEITFPFKG